MSTLAPIHSVHFYDTHKTLIDRLFGLVSSGFAAGNSVMIVATQDHRRQLIDALERAGIDVPMLTAEKRFVMYDTKETLATFMVGDRPLAPLFMVTVRELLSGVKQSAGHGVVVFGEMVAALWEDGNRDGALELERLCNSLLNETPFHMHCAYPRALFSDDQAGMFNICKNHSHLVGG